MSAGAVAPASRNALCPCGSGRRYEDCHGALAKAPVAPAPPPASYRPAGRDWDALDAATRGALAEQMAQALAFQSVGADAPAEKLYLAVLARAPDTHDALHMLGVARWRQGDLYGARRYIERAKALRPPYDAIQKNLDSIQRTIDARTLRGQERLSEASLPLLFGFLETERPDGERHANAPSARQPGEALHLVRGSFDPGDDAAWIFEQLAALLAPWRCVSWSDDAPPLASRSRRRLDPDVGAFPVGGVHVHVGLDHVDQRWIDQAAPRRVVAIGTRARAGDWLLGLRRLARDGAVPLLPVFLTPGQASRFGRTGPTLPALPHARAAAVATAPREAWTLGLVAGDPRQVLESKDAPLLERLAERGVAIAVRDPVRLRFALGHRREVRFVSRTASSLEAFCASVDALLVPFRPWQDEGLAREIAYARAAGRPVIVPARSIHALPRADAASGDVRVVADEKAAIEAVLDLRDRAGGKPIGIAAAGRPDDSAAIERVRAELDAIIGLGRREVTA